MYFKSQVGGLTSGYISEYPLSQGQAALWFQYKLAPEAVTYNLAGAVVIPRDADLNALQRAFQKLAVRHPQLRAVFTTRHGNPFQCVQTYVDADFRCIDSTEWSIVQLDERLEQEIYRPFDLKNGPTWRVRVFQQAPILTDTKGIIRDHLVLLTLHHIIGDLWSISVILSEVAALYRAEIAGAEAALKPLRSIYVDHVKKEIEQLGGPQAERSWDYWRTALSGELPTLSLPIDRPYPPLATGRGAAQSIHFDQQFTNELGTLAEKEHVARYKILLTAFQILLHRYTGQNDILLGFPKAGRSPNMARVVGYFVNQTVVRADLSENPGFIDLLQKTHSTIEESAAYDSYPFSLLVQRLHPERDFNRSPLIQAVFSWQRAPRLIPRKSMGELVLGQSGQKIELDGLFLRSVNLTHRAAPFDLMMLATESREGLEVTIEYATDIFKDATIARMAQCYRALLESILADPEKRADDFNILPLEQRDQLVEDWNATQAPYPDNACLHNLFEYQVEQTPNMVAVADEKEELTYRQLNQRANQLAHYLQNRGINPDTLVGIYMEPSVKMVVAMLGILKAGGAYLPLDPAYPDERLAFMLADAKPKLLITRLGLPSSLIDHSGASIITDTDKDDIQIQTQTNPPSPTTPDQLAYVIYTSGSSGRPKGVALAHRGVVSLLTDFQKRKAIQPGDACSWWTSPGFDVSVYEIFSPLLAGGSLQVIPQDVRLDAGRLTNWLDSHHIRSAYLPPFLLEDFADWVQYHPGVLSLRRLLVGVEPIPFHLLTRLIAHQPDLFILNGYGPTETTICSTLYEVDAERPDQGNTPIGKPVANTQIYLLDRALQPVPLGVVGEIFIGGIGLARGYLNQPTLTSQRFIPSPFRPGEKLYRTGDLARYLPDGNLMFMGRSDDQVKIYGMRIELGEIETVLAEHPLVKQAAVSLNKQASGGKHLTAYVIPSNGTAPSPRELRQYLNQRLPSAMVPSAFFVLDSFPQTPSGKIDRKAFPASQNLPSTQVRAYRAPKTYAEQTLAAIWQQVLGIEHIGVDNNFFELGGDSIMSLQIVARAGEAGLHLKPQHLFQSPTIAGLAILVDTGMPPQNQQEEYKTGGVIPLTPIQRWFFEQNFPNPHHWNQSLMFITPQPLDPIHLRSAVADLLMEHDALRLRYTNGPQGWVATLADFKIGQIPFETIDLSALDGPLQTDAIKKNIATQQISLNLVAGPLIRVVYFVLGADHPGRLLIVIHHLCVDAVSWRILLESLLYAYQQHQRGLPLAQYHRTTSFPAWALRLEDYAQTPDLLQEKSFWLNTFENDLPTLPADLLPPDLSPDVLNTEATARIISVSLSHEETQELLLDASTPSGSQINAVLLAALARAFQRRTGQETFRIDLEGHGRQNIFGDIDLSQTVGWFTVLYPVRLCLPQDTPPGEAIKIIRKQLQQIPHHGLGYGLLRYICSDPTVSEQFKIIKPASVSFNYLGRLPQADSDGLISGLAPESLGHQRCPDAQRSHLIEINAAVYKGELKIDWSYSSKVHSRRTIELVSSLFIEELRILISYSSQAGFGYIPSDFPDVGLSQAELDTIIKNISKSNETTHNRNLESIYPSSPMQEGMVFYTLYSPESGVYFEQSTFSVQGEFDVLVFEKVWQRVIERHSILRTSFVWQGLDRMLQVVHKDIQVPLDLMDWRSIPAAEQRSRLEDLLTSERSRGFDLTVPPLLRLDIVQTADDEFQILVNHHHALLDGWSVSLLFKEVFDFYNAFARGQDITLPPARPFRDYINWLQAQDFSTAEGFWCKELHGLVPPSGNLLHPSKSLLSGARLPAVQDEHLSSQTTAALQSLARQEHLTISTLVQGAWAILLSCYYQRDEVVFGVTVAGRPHDLTGIETMVGLFINTLPLRVNVAYEIELLDWLRYLQKKAIEIGRYEYSPLAKIQSWSGIPRGSSLFDTILVIENYPAHLPVQERYSSLQIRNLRSIEQSNYLLTVAATPGERLNLKILYDPARIEKATVSAILNNICQVLEGMVAEPNARLSALLSLVQSEADPHFLNWTQKIRDHSTQSSPLFQGQLERDSDGTARSEPKESYPRNTLLERYLVGLWKELLKVDQVGINDDFLELGGDSLTGAICIQRIQENLNETIPLSAIFEASTVLELSTYLGLKYPAGIARRFGPVTSVSSAIKETVHPSALVPIQPKGNRPPLFCVHPAGGIVFPYYTLVPYLSDDQPLYGIQDPSLYGNQSTPKSIDAMAKDYLTALKTVQPEGPYNILGWSAGGVVAYEMAQQLSRQGEPVGLLIMLDTKAPSIAKEFQEHTSLWNGLLGSISSIRFLPKHIKRIGAAVSPIASYIRSGLFLLTASVKHNGTRSSRSPTIADLLGWVGLDTWRTHLLKEAEVANIVSQDSSLRLIQMPAVRRILGLVRKHRQLVRHYEAEPYRGQITLFRASPSEPDKKESEDVTLGWKRLAEAGVEVHSIRANHVALLVKPNVEILAREINLYLAKGCSEPNP